MERFRPLIRAVGVAGLLALLVQLMVGGGDVLTKGAQAPATRGVALDGGAFDLEQWRGQLVFVNVWATWCGPCLQELPELAASSVKWRDQVRFVGLAVESPRRDIDVIAGRFGIPYPVVPVDAAVQSAWHADALPSSYLVGPDGTLLWSVRGALTASALDDVLQRAVAQMPPVQPAPALQSAPAPQSETTRP